MSIRKIFFLFLCFCIALIFSACSNGDKSGKGAEKGTGFPAVSQGKDTDKTKNDNKKIDVDLTTLSSTMVYSEVYNMITEPDDYLDKTVKMNGSFAVQHDEETGKNYYACIIKDAAACCSQGLEFELSDDYKYPDDYPNEGEIISVVGVFDVYQEGDSEYCVLRKADLVDR